MISLFLSPNQQIWVRDYSAQSRSIHWMPLVVKTTRGIRLALRVLAELSLSSPQGGWGATRPRKTVGR